VVEDVERFKANLELGLAVDVERAEETGVEDRLPRAPELVAVRVGQGSTLYLPKICVLSLGM
jgi:hypothetical protein